MNRSVLARYGVALLVIGVVVLIKLLLEPLLPGPSRFLLLSAAVMVAAWFGGLGPGIFATVLGAGAADYLFLPPYYSISGPGSHYLVLLLFTAQGVVISALTEALRKARGKAEESVREARGHQENLRRSEERFRLLVEGVEDYAIFMLDPEGRVVSWNAGAERISGYGAEEIVGEHHSAFFTEEDLGDGRPEKELEVAATEGRYEEEIWRVRRDGSGFWADVVITALRDADGELRGFSQVTRDITAKREAERQLREAENRLRTLVEHVPAITYTEEVGPHKSVTYVSPQVEKVLGYSPEEMMADPDHWIETVHPDDRERVLAEDERTDETGEPFAIEYRQFARDGRVVWVRDEAVLVRDEEGKALHWQGFVLDVTERKMAEEKLRESEELYRNVVEQAAENIFLIDAETKRVLRANASLHRSLGYDPEELNRLTLYDIVAHDREAVDRNIRRVLEEGRRFIGERRYRRKDGALIDVEVNAAALSYGGREALCIVAHDVTERKRIEGALRRSLDSLLALYETGQVLSSSLEREEIGSRLLEIMGRISGTRAAVIHLYDGDARRAWRSVGPEDLLGSIRDDREAEAARHAALEGEERRLFEVGAPGARLVGLALPLRVRDTVTGVLEVYGPESLAGSGAAETFASLANHAASALENARLYEELAAREHQLQELLRMLLSAQEEERRRVAYDVHDGLAQTAAAAYHHLQAFERHYGIDTPRSRERLREALELSQQTVGEARQVIADLRPTVLDDFGLAAAVRLQVETLRSEGWEVDYEETLGDERLPAEVETTLFRVAQEALTNVRKHARTSRAHVVLGRSNGTVRLVVRDEGGGFRPREKTNGDNPGERIGLSGMRERITLLGGRFEVQSVPGDGTSVSAEVQVPTTEKDARYG